MSMTGDGARNTETRLREGLEATLGLTPSSLEPTARIDELLPPERRVELWRTWQERSGVPLPALDHSFSTKMAWFAGGFVAALFALAALRTAGIHVPGSTVAGGVVGVLLGAVGLRLLGGKPLGLPPGVRTIADLAHRVEMRNR